MKNNQSNCIPTNELKNTLDLLGYSLPNHEVRELTNRLKKDGKLNEFEGISKELLKQVCLCFCLHLRLMACAQLWFDTRNLRTSANKKSKQENSTNKMQCCQFGRNFAKWANFKTLWATRNSQKWPFGENSSKGYHIKMQ